MSGHAVETMLYLLDCDGCCNVVPIGWFLEQVIDTLEGVRHTLKDCQIVWVINRSTISSILSAAFSNIMACFMFRHHCN